ncbi:MAG: apolipoprotein N-acyltransferase, partial [Caldimonas sp.]
MSGPDRRLPALGDAAFVAALGAAQTLVFVHTAFWPAQMLAVAALAVLLSLYLAAALAAVARWRGRAPLASAALFAAVWLLAELARGVIFTGFPWLASGYAQVASPRAGDAPRLGVYGVGAVAARTAAAYGFGRLDSPRGWLAPGAALLLALGIGALAGRVDFTQPTATLSVTLLQ